MNAPNLANIERRLEALERANAEKSDRAQANVGPLGLWAFALTTALLQIGHLRVGTSAQSATGIVIGFAFGFGGLVQLIAGVISATQGKQFPAVAFSSYGGFWLSFGVYEALVYSEIVARDNIAEQSILIMWGVLTAALFICSFRSNAALMTLFAFLTVLFLLIGASKNPQSEKTQFASAIWGIVTAIIAFYAGFGELVNDTYRSRIVPLGSFESETDAADDADKGNDERIRIIS
jgi:succinate-acetate transporter protein